MIMERSLPTGASTFAGRTCQHTTKTYKRAYTLSNAEKESQWLTRYIVHSFLTSATTPYTDRYAQLKTRDEKR